VRIPPIRLAQRYTTTGRPAARGFEAETLYEDEALLVLNKPSGVAVHGGSGVSFGMVEQLRQARPEARFLELVHRLDRDTSGVLILAKKRSALTALHAQLREGRVRKYYLTLVHGRWRSEKRHVKLALSKYVLPSGERRVSVAHNGLPSHTVFRLKRSWQDFSLLEAELRTGRTHQIRVHLAHLGFPIAGDDKYGDFALNRELARRGLKRMFLHACKTVIAHPTSGGTLTLEAPLPADLQNFLLGLDGPECAN
jgi:23S rRNA pseudouridine955/2504/2580 synthase